MKRFFILFFMGMLLYLSATSAIGEPNQSEVPDALMLRFPDVNADKIVFVYAGDLWIVPKEGGLARQLSSPKGHEAFPKFSPNGETIAFSGNYDGWCNSALNSLGGTLAVNVSASTTVTVENCTVVDSSTENDGGAIYVLGGELQVNNTIFWKV